MMIKVKFSVNLFTYKKNVAFAFFQQILFENCLEQ